MRWFIKFQYSIITGIICLAIGYFCGKELDYTCFTLNDEISVVDILTLLVTIFLAIYVGHVIEKVNESSRTEKTLIISSIERLDNISRDVANNFISGKIEYQIAASGLKKIGTGIQRIKKRAEMLGWKTQDEFDEILKKHRQLRNLTTDTPSTDNNDSNEIKVKQGMIEFSSNRTREIHNEFESFYLLLFELLIKINRN